MKNKKAVIVQCRLSSTRLPEKALKELGGKTVLDWVLSSMKKVKANKYYVATDESSYKFIKPICDANGFNCFAGDLNNVLKRFCDLIKKIKVDTIIRATADNPFLFYEAAQESLNEFEKINKYRKTCDYLTYTGLPHGSGVEIIDAESLLEAEQLTDSDFDKEHVGPALYNHKDRFNCEFIRAPQRYYFPNLRTTIDTYSDYLRAVSIVNYVSGDVKVKDPYTTEQILEALDSNKIKNPMIFYPSTVKGHGTGHLQRCLKCAIKTDSYIYIPKDKTLSQTDDIVESYFKKGLKKYQVINELPDETFSPVIITDLFMTEKKDIIKLSKYKSIIGLDEGSKNSDCFDYLVDVIPSYDLLRQANINEPAFIEKPENVKKIINTTNSNFQKILISIGGEDPTSITFPILDLICQIFPLAKITVTNNAKEGQIGNVNYVSQIENLKESIYEYDLVITHYGLTAFEATYAGCAVVLVSTTKLHEKLAQKYNYAYIPFGKINIKVLKEILDSNKIYPEKLLGNKDKSLALFLTSISNGHRMNCPICQRQDFVPDPIISRNISRTYRRCKSCGVIYMSWSSEQEKSYEKQYFFEDYKKQYGKTYKEDFESIKNQSLKRVSVISNISKSNKNLNILDVGCAYGPFLAACSEKHMNPFGTDISSDAIDYVKNELHYPASTAIFPQIDTETEFGVSKFDAVTMWYVIEHFKNLDIVLKKINNILKKDGIFAFSTPSGEGVSATTNIQNFYIQSPTDHFSIWEPSKANKILKPYGFQVVKIVSTGHHPERFPQIKKSGAQPGSIQWNTIKKISEAKKLGDTVEIYCRKIKEL